ncbi:hypothetical protein PoB_005337000 [Plakobranchus ocellatus]|uniref:Uncharacterized protein n=1 Tax=Plakobranchus ocellatus TaxID=259542 RepID=A0AAV4C617_9GAST|nr:hypothetical protein PoB_005337000 [Plakobranchus ocellatus]
MISISFLRVVNKLATLPGPFEFEFCHLRFWGKLCLKLAHIVIEMESNSCKGQETSRAAIQNEASINLSKEDLAQRKKNDQGLHECEVLGTFGSDYEAGPESDFAWNNCTKNPGHPRFIPTQEFSLNDLPIWCRKLSVLNYVRRLSDLTVRLRVGYTSWGRPNGYCFSNCRGTKIVHYGSGAIRSVRAETGPCPCPECEHSPSPNQTWYKVFVTTALHVVYNTEEAKATKIDLFYDSKGCIEDGRMKTIHGMNVVDVDRVDEGDNSFIMCATHDTLLVQKIEDHWKQLHLGFSGQLSAKPIKCWRNLCVMVSHPHGQPKKVTIGEMKGCEMLKFDGQKEFTYSTDSCRGSSGAFMLLLEFYQLVRGVSWQTGMMWSAVHSSGGLGDLPNISGWTPAIPEDWPTPFSVSICRALLWLFGLTWLSERFF